jgi:hypothetical protein
VQQFENYVDDSGNLRSRPVVDSKGNPILNRQAVAARDRLLDELGSLKVPEGPLEILLNHFGADKVAEVTGRGQRVVRKENEAGRVVPTVEKRGAQANVADADLFQAGKKPILVFSEAGGTGRSYHAAIGSGSDKRAARTTWCRAAGAPTRRCRASAARTAPARPARRSSTSSRPTCRARSGSSPRSRGGSGSWAP